MAEKLDYSNLGFAYHTPEKRYVSNYKNVATAMLSSMSRQAFYNIANRFLKGLRLIVGKMDLSFASVRI